MLPVAVLMRVRADCIDGPPLLGDDDGSKPVRPFYPWSLNMIRRAAVALCLCVVCGTALQAADKTDKGFVPLMDGKSFEGWKASENSDSWKLKDGAFVANGPRSHLFYVGDKKPFRNFELKLDVMTHANSNGGVYFHTKYQETGWPKYGFEAQVNNSYKRDPKMTGSLYAVVNVLEAPAKDNEWFEYHIIVNGDRVTLKVDGKTLVDYTEPEGTKAGKDFTRKLDEGTFALQAHDPGSTVAFRNIRVKRLP